MKNATQTKTHSMTAQRFGCESVQELVDLVIAQRRARAARHRATLREIMAAKRPQK